MEKVLMRRVVPSLLSLLVPACASLATPPPLEPPPRGSVPVAGSASSAPAQARSAEAPSLQPPTGPEHEPKGGESADAPPEVPLSCKPRGAPKRHGVVPDEMLPRAEAADAPFSVGTDVDGTAVGSLLKKCILPPEQRSSSTCVWDAPAVLGFDKKGARMAALTAKALATAGEEWPELPAATFDLASMKAPSRRTWPEVSTSRTGRPAELDAYVTRLRAQGFTELPENLVVAQATGIEGSSSFRPLAWLGAPLCGWMVHVAAVGRTVSVKLVTPDNEKGFTLETFPLEQEKCVVFDGAQCAVPTSVSLFNVEQVVLSPGDRFLVVLTTAQTGAHNGPLYPRLSRYPLPEAAKAALQR